jgi:hypothetical protein
MEINITRFFNEASPMDYSASVAEIGSNAGAYTWQAACDDSSDYFMLDDDEKRDAFRLFVKESSGWTEEEIKEWSDIELNALFIQWVAGDIRECFEWDCDDIWANYAELSEAGTVSGNIFRADDGQIYFYLGV